MTAPHGRSYPHRAIIFVDPDQAESAADGDPVIAELLPGKPGHLPGPRHRRGQSPPAGAQPPYLPITQEFQVLGKVVGM